MSEDNQRQDATTNEVSRPVVSGRDADYSLSIDDAVARYEAAGIPRTRRSGQRYCANGAIDSHRIETSFGEKYLITPESVNRHIAYINEVRPVVTSQDLSRHVATSAAIDSADDPIGRPAATTADASRPVAADARVIELLEDENQFLREQVGVKDKQIADQLERAHEMNALVIGLQRMLSPLLSGGDRSTEPRN